MVCVPSAAFFESDASAAKNVERTADREIDLTSGQALDKLQIRDVASPAGVGYGYCTDVREMLDELLIDAGLQAFSVCGMNEKFAAVGFEEFDVGCVVISILMLFEGEQCPCLR